MRCDAQPPGGTPAHVGTKRASPGCQWGLKDDHFKGTNRCLGPAPNVALPSAGGHLDLNARPGRRGSTCDVCSSTKAPGQGFPAPKPLSQWRRRCLWVFSSWGLHDFRAKLQAPKKTGHVPWVCGKSTGRTAWGKEAQCPAQATAPRNPGSLAAQPRSPGLKRH